MGGTASPAHVANWYGGWGFILAAFIVGAAIGSGFHREDFLGGYNSFRRRLLRLGHIALAALGLLNVVYALGPWPAPGSWQAIVSSAGLLVGGAAMPAVCFLSAWREPFRHWFFLPVTALLVAVLSILLG